MNLFKHITILTTAASAFVTTHSHASSADHSEIYATPVPGPITIDGQLDDWDLSGQIEMVVVEETKDSQNAKFALMYDDDAIYISAVVRDDSPMMNRHDPRNNAEKAWDADSTQFRMVIDAKSEYPVEENVFIYRNDKTAVDQRDDIIHLLFWYFTDRQEANLQLKKGMTYRLIREEWGEHGVVPNDLFEAKYVKMEDGLGYQFEYRIPWSLLDAPKALEAGDKVAGTAQFTWSRPDGLASAGGSAWAYGLMRAPGFPYQNANTWGLIHFSADNNLAPELTNPTTPEVVKELPLEFNYELPEDSEVSIQLVNQEGVIVRQLVAQEIREGGSHTIKWDGLDDQGSPLPAGTYKWQGNYHDPIQLKALFSPHNAGQPSWPMPDRTGAWGGDHGRPADAVALPGGVLLTWDGSEYGTGIIRVDLDGKKIWGSKNTANHIATDGERYFTIEHHGFQASTGVKVFDAKDSRGLRFKNTLELQPPAGVPEDHLSSGLAYSDGKIYVSYKKSNLVAIFDADSGDLLQTLDVKQPGHLTARSDGALAIQSDNEILLAQDGTIRSWITTHLDQPKDIAINSNGDCYVVNQGELMNISVFNAQGKYLRSIGLKGGRPAIGNFDRNGMYLPEGITIDENQNLWVTENADYPKRISRWDAASGEWNDEFFGPSSYFGYGYIDPAKPNEIYSHNALWKIDWKNNTTEIISTIWRKTTPNAMDDIAPDAYNGTLRVFTDAQGNQFAYGNSNRANNSILAIREGNLFKPFMATFRIARGKYAYKEVQFDILNDEEKYPDGFYFWQDANDDQTVQDDEITQVNTRQRLKFRWVTSDLSVWISDKRILSPVSFGSDGRPHYDIDQLKASPLSPKKDRINYTWGDAENNIYTLSLDKGPGLAKWNQQGEMLWSYPGIKAWGKSLGLPPVKAGRLWGMTGPLGFAGEFTGNLTYFGPAQIFTTDGQYVACLLKDSRINDDPSLEGQPEGQGGQLVKLEIEGKERYFLIAGGNDARVIEIFGLDTFKRLSGGEYIITPEEAAHCRSALAASQAGEAEKASLAIAYGKDSLDKDENKVKGSVIEAGKSEFEASLAYDESHLYVRFDVTSPYPLLNGQSNHQILFRGGNALDIQIAADTKADPEREKPQVGDQRLLVSQLKDGETLAVIYQPKLENFDGKPITLNSPTGSETFDRIEVVSDQIGLEYKPYAGGFVAYVTIPQALLNVKLSKGQKYQIDIGYVFGNDEGTKTQSRSYWSNNGFSANVVNDIPHESRLVPNEWGTAEIR